MNRRQMLRNVGLVVGVGSAALAGFIAYPLIAVRAQKELLISGSNAVSRFVALLTGPFVEKHPHIKVAIQGGGSLPGLVALDNGGIDLAMMSRDLDFNEFNLDIHSHLIGIEGIAIVVHPSQSIKSITLEQLLGIFEGDITHWSQIGGANKKINVYNRDEDSTTRAFVDDVVLRGGKFTRDAKLVDSAIKVSNEISADPDGIGYLTAKNLSEKVKAVSVNGVEISDKSLLLKLYPLSRDMFLVSRNSASQAAKDFVRFSLSAAGQEILVKHGLTQVSR